MNNDNSTVVPVHTVQHSRFVIKFTRLEIVQLVYSM